MWNEYHICKSKENAITLLANYDGKARIIAGGTDLLIELENKKLEVPALVDVTRIPAFSKIYPVNGVIHIGAAVTFTQLIESEIVREQIPHLHSAASVVGGKQIQNVATIVGNVVNASPAADSVCPLYTMDATVHGVDPDNREWHTPIGDFITGVNQTRIPEGGLVTGITIPMLPNGWRTAFRKLGLRNSMAISVVNCAITLKVSGGYVRDARIALGAVAPTIIRAIDAEKALIGETLKNIPINEVSKLARAAVRPIDDLRASASYRSEMVERVVRQEIMRVTGQSQEDFDAT